MQIYVQYCRIITCVCMTHFIESPGCFTLRWARTCQLSRSPPHAFLFDDVKLARMSWNFERLPWSRGKNLNQITGQLVLNREIKLKVIKCIGNILERTKQKTGQNRKQDKITSWLWWFGSIVEYVYTQIEPNLFSIKLTRRNPFKLCFVLIIHF